MQITGMHNDSDQQNQTPDKIRYGRNILITDGNDIIENEPGFDKKFEFASQRQCVGIVSLNDSAIIFAKHRSDGGSYIYSYEGGTVAIPIISPSDVNGNLGFSFDNPIEGEFYINGLGQRIVAWIEDGNIPRILNIDAWLERKILGEKLNLDEFELFPSAQLPIPKASTNESSGSLSSGGYRISYQLIRADGATSNYAPFSRPVSVSSVRKGPINSYQGSVGGELSRKSINITVDGVDPDYVRASIIAVVSENGIVSVRKYREIPLQGSSFNTFITGSENFEVLTIEEVLAPKAYYIRAKAITQLNRRLYLGNLKSNDFTDDEKINIQRIANQIEIRPRLRVQVITNGFGSYNIGFQQNDVKGSDNTFFMPGEVYAFYVAPKLKTGEYGPAFHIPGPVSPSAAVYGTNVNAQNITGKSFQFGDFSSSSINPGQMGYWGNQTEFYPNTTAFNNVPTDPQESGSPNKRVRHHQFKSSRLIAQHLGNNSVGLNRMYGYDIEVFNVLLSNLPASTKEKIEGWRIFYARRTTVNSTNLGQSLLNYVLRAYSIPGSNIDITRKASLLNRTLPNSATSRIFLDPYYFTFQPFNLLLDQPEISPSFLELEVFYTKVAHYNSFYLDNTSRGLSDLTKRFRKNGEANVVSTTEAASPILNNYILPCSFLGYVEGGGVLNVNGISYDARNSHPTMLFKYTGDVLGVNNILARYNIQSFKEINVTAPLSTDTNVTYLASLKTLQTNVYEPFQQQDLLATSVERRIDQPSSILSYSDQHIPNGDVYAGANTQTLMTFATFSEPFDPKRIPEDQPFSGHRIAVWHGALSPKNFNLRYDDINDGNTVYYPVSDANPGDLFQKIDGRIPYKILFNNDFAIRDDLHTVVPYDPNIKSINVFPNTITRSIQVDDDNDVAVWSDWLAGERYTMPRNKGNISNLQSLSNFRMLIHLEHGLFITAEQTKLETSIAAITLGSGDLFRVAPQEIVTSSNSFGGTQHKFSCHLSRAGYFFVDVSQGKIFNYDGQLNNISDMGLEEFFRQNLAGSPIRDNPFDNNGITTAFDERYKRYIISFNTGNSTTSFTLSFAKNLSERGGWVSFHDYIPNFLFSLSGLRLFSIKSGPQVGGIVTNNQVGRGGASGGIVAQSIFEHNSQIVNQKYYTDTIYPMYLDMVMNQGGLERKSFKGIEWFTRVFDENGNEYPDETFTHIAFSNNHKTTGRLTLSSSDSPVTRIIDNANMRDIFGGWNFNNIRDLSEAPRPIRDGLIAGRNISAASVSANRAWFKKAKIVDTWLEVRFEFTPTNANRQIQITGIIPKTRKAFR